MIINANKKRSDKSFEVKDYVYLKLQPYRQQSISHRSSKQLAANYYGLYQVIVKVGTVAYKLDLPTAYMVHPVFHVSQLKKHVGNQIVQRSLPIIDHGPTCNPEPYWKDVQLGETTRLLLRCSYIGKGCHQQMQHGNSLRI